MFKSILVLESPWDTQRVHSPSVWPFVSEFAKVAGISAYHQVFSDKASFRHWVARYSADDVPTPKLLYVAAHGAGGRIAGLKRNLNGTTIVDSLRRAKGIKFVHFGSCLFGSKQNLTSLLNLATHLHWAAGYHESIDWIDSMAFDMLLWGRIAARNKTTKGLKTQTLAKHLLAEIPGLATNLGFRFAYRHGEKSFCVFHDKNGAKTDA